MGTFPLHFQWSSKEPIEPWLTGEEKPENLLDPTARLRQALGKLKS